MVSNTPNAMPRYYRDKIFESIFAKKLVQWKKLNATLDKPTPPPTAWDHEKLLNKLNRKHR